MSSLLRDVRHSVRTLRQSPGFTAVAVLTLAIGIGANTAIFSFVDAMLLRPLPYPDADRIVRVMEKPPRGERNGISTLNFSTGSATTPSSTSCPHRPVMPSR